MECDRESWIFPTYYSWGGGENSKWISSSEWWTQELDLCSIRAISWTQRSYGTEMIPRVARITSSYYWTWYVHLGTWWTPSRPWDWYTTWDRHTDSTRWWSSMVWIVFRSEAGDLWTLGSWVTPSKGKYYWNRYWMLFWWSTHGLLSRNSWILASQSKSSLQGTRTLENKKRYIELYFFINSYNCIYYLFYFFLWNIFFSLLLLSRLDSLHLWVFRVHHTWLVEWVRQIYRICSRHQWHLRESPLLFGRLSISLGLSQDSLSHDFHWLLSRRDIFHGLFHIL